MDSSSSEQSSVKRYASSMDKHAHQTFNDRDLDVAAQLAADSHIQINAEAAEMLRRVIHTLLRALKLEAQRIMQTQDRLASYASHVQ